MKELPILYKRKEECCGCTACYAICPKEAISMVEDAGQEDAHEQAGGASEDLPAGAGERPRDR